MSHKKWTTAVLACAWLTAIPAAAQDAKAKSASDNYDELYNRYLNAARTAAAPAAPGQDISWMAGLSQDLRARRVNDLVTVRVIESIAASGSADSSLDKNSSGSASLTKFFGLEGRLPSSIDPTSLANTTSKTTFKGGGATSRTGELSAIVTARVVEVLPNGDLVLEGAREIDINGDRQIVVLTGMLRTADIQPGNVALSTSIGQLRIRYFGRGLIKDNLQPGWIIRVLNKIF
jgi:flagellar L-ring protein precursor FlgH